MPERIQRKRTKGWRMPPNTVYVGRPSTWGNPFHIGMFKDYDAADAVNGYQRWMRRELSFRSCENTFGRPPTKQDIRAALRGKNLCCWCSLDQPCHADTLLRLANCGSARNRAEQETT